MSHFELEKFLEGEMLSRRPTVKSENRPGGGRFVERRGDLDAKYDASGRQIGDHSHAGYEEVAIRLLLLGIFFGFVFGGASLIPGSRPFPVSDVHEPEFADRVNQGHWSRFERGDSSPQGMDLFDSQE